MGRVIAILKMNGEMLLQVQDDDGSKDVLGPFDDNITHVVQCDKGILSYPYSVCTSNPEMKRSGIRSGSPSLSKATPVYP